MSIPQIIQFKVLCHEARLACEANYSTDYFEPYFVRVLEYIGKHPEFRPEIALELIKMLSDGNRGPWELIPFLMHELRWDEVKSEAERLIHDEKRDFRVKAIMSHVLEGFFDNWENADMYEYYREQTKGTGKFD